MHPPRVPDKDTPYLDTNGAELIIARPFPWGARATLNKFFQQWQWTARPLQPKGRSVDGKGMLWDAQVVKDPRFSVRTLDHAGILIAAVPQKAKGAQISHTKKSRALPIPGRH